MTLGLTKNKEKDSIGSKDRYSVELGRGKYA